MARKVSVAGMGESYWEFLILPHTSETCCPWPSHFLLVAGKYMGDGWLVDDNCPFSDEYGRGESGFAREGKRELRCHGDTVTTLTNISPSAWNALQRQEK